MYAVIRTGGKQYRVAEGDVLRIEKIKGDGQGASAGIKWLLDKTRTTQGDNQVLRYQYRLLVSSYKPEAVKLQLWDRLPHADTEALSVSLVKSTPPVSADPLYERENKADNLLRWDLTVEPGRNGEKALAVHYEFKLELGRQMRINSITAGTQVGIPLPEAAPKMAPRP